METVDLGDYVKYLTGKQLDTLSRIYYDEDEGVWYDKPFNKYSSKIVSM